MKQLLTVMTAAAAAFFLASGAVSAQTVATAATATNSIQNLEVVQQGADIVVKVELKEAPSSLPAGFSVANPPRVALDFTGVANGLGRTSQTINQGDLTSANIVQVGDRTRLVFNMTRNMQHSVSAENNNLYVTFKAAAGSSGAASTQSTRFAEEILGDRQHAIKDISFKRGKEGEGRVIVDLTDAGTGIDIKQQGTALVVDFLKTSLPESLRRKLDVTDFATPVTAVTTATQGDNVRMTITPKGLWEHSAYQAESQFVIEVKPIIEDPNKLVQGSKIGYQGPLVSINYQNGDVRALLRLMAEELGLSAVISETVTGTTTLVLKDVPADQVIDIIFRQKSLDMRKNGNVILIAPREELALREKLDYEAKQQIGDLEPMQMEAIQLNYQKAADVAKLLNGVAVTGTSSGSGGTPPRLLSKRGSVTAEPVTNTIFVNDIASKREEIRRFVKTIDVGSKQVLIEARLVEANDDFNKNIGVRMNFLNRVAQPLGKTGVSLGGGSYSVTPGTLEQKLETTAAGGSAATSGNGSASDKFSNTYTGSQSSPSTAGVNMPGFQTGGGGLAFSLFNSSLTKILNVELAALEADGRGRFIASPKLVTANNVPAKVEDGFEIPYEVCSFNGCVIAFRPAKLSLETTPQITPDGRVKMKLIVTRDDPDWSRAIRGIPPIKSSKIETDVIVDNGGTVVIGGIFVSNSTNSTEKVPLLGDLPYLGLLFKNNNLVTTKRELLIFITPRVISEQLTLR